MYFENPDQEVSFGEAYRQILNESSFVPGSWPWGRVGKSRRGRRPPYRGVDNPNLSEAQRWVRWCFQLCVDAWNKLPWEISPGAYCDGRYSKSWWLSRKLSTGVPCSYYDLYMRSALKFTIQHGHLPPWAYSVSIGGSLHYADPDFYYPITFTNNVGPISMIDGLGSYDILLGWKPGPDCGSGYLCFQDENGALGKIQWESSPGYALMSLDTFNTGTTVSPGWWAHVVVLCGKPPFTYHTVSWGYTFEGQQTYQTADRDVLLHCAPGDPVYNYDAYCTYTVTDSCGTVVGGSGFEIRNSMGHWGNSCGGGSGPTEISYTKEFISGIHKLVIKAGRSATPAADVNGECTPSNKYGHEFLCVGCPDCLSYFTPAQFDAMWIQTLQEGGFWPTRICKIWGYFCGLMFANRDNCMPVSGPFYQCGYVNWHYDWIF